MPKKIVMYPGRFQPFHSGHKEVYDEAVKKYGKENVYIITSNKVDPPRSPLNFNERKKVITTMFSDIPADKIIMVKNGYRPIELMEKKPDDIVSIHILGEKDAERLTSGKYFIPLNTKGKNNIGHKEHGYVDVIPNKKVNMSGSKVREIFNGDDEDAKKELFEELYGKMNKSIFNLLNKKIVNEELEIPNFLIEETDYVECMECHKEYKQINELLIVSDYFQSPDSELLLCGGAYGHLSHFHDVKTNTFNDLKEFIDTVLQGKMDYARIKTDGQNLMFSIIDGELRVARNKGDLKNRGERSMTIKQLGDKFEGRENIQNAFTAGAEDLQTAIKKLPQDKVDEIFENGKNWMSVEVINPKTENVIPYGTYELRFHGIREYDENANITGEDKGASDTLAKMIEDIKENKQNTYEIKSLEVAKFPPMPDFKAQKAYFNKKVDALQKEFGMKPTSTLTDVFRKQFSTLIKSHAKDAKYAIPKAELSGLVKRWAEGDKTFNARDIKKISNEDFKNWAIAFDKNDAKRYAKQIGNKFEYLTLELGAVVLKNMSSFMVANPEKSIQKLKQGIDAVVKEINNTSDPALADKMRYELERLSAIGGMDAIAPEEGVTFLFKDNFYKLTGTFAPVNQLLGLLRYKR